MKKILLVEDDKYIAEEIFNRTKMWDMDCLVVEDFKDVLSTFNEYDPSIVLLDISLPFMMAIIGVGKLEKYLRYLLSLSLLKTMI